MAWPRTSAFCALTSPPRVRHKEAQPDADANAHGDLIFIRVLYNGAVFHAKLRPVDPIRPNFFAGPYIDRRADVREEAGWPAAALSRPRNSIIMALDTAQLVYTGLQPRIAFVTRAAPSACVSPIPTR